MREAPDVRGTSRPPVVGTVESWDKSAGKGLIVGAFGSVVVFASEVIGMPNRRHLVAGEAVTFILIDDIGHGRYAAEVRPAPEPALARTPLHPCPSCWCRP